MSSLRGELATCDNHLSGYDQKDIKKYCILIFYMYFVIGVC